jgi:hypothetical protein
MIKRYDIRPRRKRQDTEEPTPASVADDDTE